MNGFFWLILGLILSFLEIFIPGMVIIFFGISAFFISLFVYLGFVNNIFYQFFLWSLISLLQILLLRNFVLKFFPSHERNEFTKDNLEGKKGIVIEEINPYKGTGKIKISGSYWKATSSMGTIIPIEKEVFVEKQDGLLLYVKVIS